MQQFPNETSRLSDPIKPFTSTVSNFKLIPINVILQAFRIFDHIYSSLGVVSFHNIQCSFCWYDNSNHLQPAIT